MFLLNAAIIFYYAAVYFRQSFSSPNVMGETMPFLPIRLTAQKPSIP